MVGNFCPTSGTRGVTIKRKIALKTHYIILAVPFTV